MLKNKNIHCFWHQNDDFTLTSKNIIWTFPGKKLSLNSICVLPDLDIKLDGLVMGICSDNITKYKK